ncbi:hypothetical protein EU805_15250 [Salipiger sp. IMCC34102]|uniref:hypothetical protein n=1 Tax=Salipiger sp. IMCC34102 TaxID=2510647 RepID=UPI00101BDB58|nr:hypothetical protein [Salipiger sp. IMCC34102]RYH01135.1 hypothetical protein EU805_15250 [Salipiger sp. IMCC34102]
MTNFIKNFLTDEDGAVTVDWVVLTAGIVVLGLAVGTSLSSSITTKTTEIGTQISGAGSDSTETTP